MSEEPVSWAQSASPRSSLPNQRPMELIKPGQLKSHGCSQVAHEAVESNTHTYFACLCVHQSCYTLELCPLTAQCPGTAWKCANWGHAPSTWASINTQWPAEVRGSCMTIYKTGATKTQGSGSWDLNIYKRWVSTISSQHFLQLCHTLSILPLFCSSPNTSGQAFITSCWPLLCLCLVSLVPASLLPE